MENTTLVTAEDLLSAWTQLAEAKGYSGYAGSGTAQQAEHVAQALEFLRTKHQADGFDTVETMAGLVAGFLLTSLGDPSEAWGVAVELVDSALWG